MVLEGTSYSFLYLFKPMYEAFESEIAALEAKYAAHPIGSAVFYGSSSIRLWPRLQKEFPSVVIENWGFGGSTLAACSHFFERAIVPRQPRALIFYAGDNDLFLGATPEEVWDSLTSLLNARDTHLGPIPFVFLSLKASPARAELTPAIIETNEWCWREVQSHEETIWVDIFHPMLDEERQPRRELYAPDALHLSRAGYALWAQQLKREVSWLAG